MRKSLIDTTSESPDQNEAGSLDGWLDLDQIATVEITSEDPRSPIENALGNTANPGWRSFAKGPQLIRLIFDNPTPIHRIALRFMEREAERSQEFAIYARNQGSDLREVVRQQFTFSPGGSTEEIEDYTVSLPSVTALELRIDPDRAHDPTHSQHFATLESLRLA